MDEYKNNPENENDIPIVDDNAGESNITEETQSFENAAPVNDSGQDASYNGADEQPEILENAFDKNNENEAQTPEYAPRTQNNQGGVRTTYVSNLSGMPRNDYNGYNGYTNPSRRNFNPYTGAPVNNPAPAPSPETDKGAKASSKPKKEKTKFSGAMIVVISASVSILLCLAIMWGGIASINVDKNGNVKFFGMTVSEAASEGSSSSDKGNDELNYTESDKNAMDYERVEPDGSITTAVENAAYSVVEISTEVVSTSFFYGEYIQSGAGSGVIIDAEDGYIITCAHVISGASTVTVTLRDGKTYGAEIVGSDSQTDIAVIKIEAEDLVEAVVADSDKLVVGQTAIAIGNPLGTLGGTVSSGIVSALDREITIDGQEYSLLQIDTSINPGNSGGGLFDITGSLIGIVNAKSGGSDSSTTIEGLGFAIPVNDALQVADDLINQGYVGGRAYLGIQVYEYDGSQNIDYSLYDYIYAGGLGVYFKEYQSGQKGDLLFGDKIIAIDGNEVSTRNEILSILADYSVGDEVTLTVSRLNSDMGRRQMIEVKVTLIEGVPTTEE